MSDKEITEHSGLMTHLLPGNLFATCCLTLNSVLVLTLGDIILADRGFTC